MSSSASPITLAITAGDPCGVGPEVILKTLAMPTVLRRARLIVIGDVPVFERTAKRLRRRLPRWRVVNADHTPFITEGPLTFLDCHSRVTFIPGRTSARAGQASLTYLDEAIRLWRAGHIQGVVTAPVTKWAIARVEPSFVGQTEYLARATRVRDVVMMFVSDTLRVVLLTRHVPLRRVGRAMDQRALATSLRLAERSLMMQFGIRRPSLAICGINPHAGEDGRCGIEEQAVIVPVLQRLRRGGMRCDGPFAADGFFAQRTHYDAVVCSYHDQGLIPFKMLARDRGCQFSVGLPMVRTSPDHGSALDIAGKGIANPGSMQYALELAARFAHHRRSS